MRPPPGFRFVSPKQVCCLKKSLYGLQQAPCFWFSKFNIALRKCYFTQSYAYYSLFTYHNRDICLCVLIYVDDLLITGNRLSSVIKFKEYFEFLFSYGRPGST